VPTFFTGQEGFFCVLALGNIEGGSCHRDRMRGGITLDVCAHVNDANVPVRSDNAAFQIERACPEQGVVDGRQHAIVIVRQQGGQECVIRDSDGSWLVAENAELLLRPQGVSRLDIPFPTPQMG